MFISFVLPFHQWPRMKQSGLGCCWQGGLCVLVLPACGPSTVLPLSCTQPLQPLQGSPLLCASVSLTAISCRDPNKWGYSRCPPFVPPAQATFSTCPTTT